MSEVICRALFLEENTMRSIPLVVSFLLLSVVGGAASAKQMPLACSVHPKRGASAGLAALASAGGAVRRPSREP